jgi:hypothetical protein
LGRDWVSRRRAKLNEANFGPESLFISISLSIPKFKYYLV